MRVIRESSGRLFGQNPLEIKDCGGVGANLSTAELVARGSTIADFAGTVGAF